MRWEIYIQVTIKKYSWDLWTITKGLKPLTLMCEQKADKDFKRPRKLNQWNYRQELATSREINGSPNTGGI